MTIKTSTLTPPIETYRIDAGSVVATFLHDDQSTELDTMMVVNTGDGKPLAIVDFSGRITVEIFEMFPRTPEKITNNAERALAVANMQTARQIADLLNKMTQRTGWHSPDGRMWKDPAGKVHVAPFMLEWERPEPAQEPVT